ncbi:hypothetical protein A1O3_09638 [Capronia epimyces CBS 606.96]|uniref:Uncharacterized protein n=1 Tax=Capronia epimyces CBS 606.96 TaxID=1182542 RepID=W9XAB6_9EURO|nr:uncharacterized protein A1O3_09638 [Capronia epimyces CBS 606.96]EXJ77412.1 hypothetical protein A1O3_09638 [Capronia epimyces CBS 606.96]
MSAKTAYLPGRRCQGTHATGSDSPDRKVSVREDPSRDDWEAWKQQFQAQLRKKRCRTPGADCSARMRR